MKIIYTKHAEEKFALLESFGWKFSKRKINDVIRNPDWVGKTKLGQKAAMSRLGEDYIIRVIYDIIADKTKVITFHPARRGRYEAKI